MKYWLLEPTLMGKGERSARGGDRNRKSVLKLRCDPRIMIEQSELAQRIASGKDRQRVLVEALAVSSVASCEAVSIYLYNRKELWWHEGYMQPLGYADPGEFVLYSGPWWRDKIHPGDREFFQRHLDEYFKDTTSRLNTLRIRFRRADGAYRDVAATTTTLFGATGERIAIISAYRDITEEIQAHAKLETELEYLRVTEAALRRESRDRLAAEKIVRKQSASLAATLNLLLCKPSLPDFIRALMRSITRECGGLWAGFWRFEKPDQPAKREIAFYSTAALERSVESFFGEHASEIARAARLYASLQEQHRCTIVLRATDRRFPKKFRDFLAKNGVESCVLSPFILGNNLLGWIAFFCSTRADEIKPDMVAFIETAARQATLAMHVTRLGAAAHEAERAIEREQGVIEREREAVFVNKLLRGAAESLNRPKGIDGIIQGVLEGAAMLLDGEAASLWVEDDDAEFSIPLWRWSASECRPVERAEAEKIRARCGKPHRRLLEKWCNARNILVESVRSRMTADFLDSVYAGLDESLHGAGRSVVILPLSFQEQTFGFINVLVKKVPDKAGERLLAAEALALQAALALRLEALSVVERFAALADERNRIARDMHDLLAQAFSGITLQIEAMRAECRDIPAPVAARLEKIRIHADRSVDQVRRSLKMLRPALLAGHSLVDALLALASETEAAHGIETRFVHRGAGVSLDSKIEGHVFAIALEAVQNAVHHACPKKITVSLKRRRNCLVLSIVDDGRGMSRRASERPTGAHYGLLNMRERARSVGAKYSLRTKRGAGTEIEVAVPIEGAAAKNGDAP